MFKASILISFCLIALSTISQTNEQSIILRIPITDEITTEGDTVSVVQIALSAFTNIVIKEKTAGLLHHSYANNKLDDTTVIATGRCYLIKGSNYYFGLKHQQDILPQAGDLLSFKATIPNCYTGLLYDMSRNSITFTTVEGKDFYNWETPFLLKKAEEENAYYKHMVKDIQYTGTEMEKQMPDENILVTSGLFKQKKLFDVMKKVTIEELKEFLKYVQARPRKYAGQKWKISEIFATWVDAGAPQVIADKN